MPVSQFKIYASSDPQGPGNLTGRTGSLVAILDACLINGYGTGSYYKAPAGWVKPMPNTGSGADCYAGYTQGGGASMSFFVNDNTPYSNEAWITGWHQLTAVAPGPLTGSLHVGYGKGQFPYASQWAPGFSHPGMVTARKSTTVSDTPRPWIVIADSTTAYMWMQDGQNVGCWMHFAIGDFYSFSGANDKWRALVMGRVRPNDGGTQNLSNGYMYDPSDVIVGNQSYGYDGNYMTVAMPGIYLAASAGGTGTSIAATKRGDTSSTPQNQVWDNRSNNANGTITSAMVGMLPLAQHDGNIWLSPIFVCEPSGNPTVRGKFRGIYMPLHYYTNFADGQIVSGSLQYPDKVFMVIRPGECTVSAFFVEISNTVDTN